MLCDPPYGLSFMQSTWDHDVPGPAYWKALSRHLLPGAILLAFSSPRTYHRLTCAIEDAGLEIREQILWLFGMGFPKSMNVSLAIDKAAGAPRTEVIGSKLGRAGMSEDGSNQRGGLRHAFGNEPSSPVDLNVYAPATAEAQLWDGYGTTLKPAHEPICMARMPLAGTVVDTVLRHGTGTLNLAASTIPTEVPRANIGHCGGDSKGIYGDGLNGAKYLGTTMQARFPANVIHDGSEAVMGVFPQTDGRGNVTGAPSVDDGMFGRGAVRPNGGYADDDGSAARYFYTAKASQGEREAGLVGHLPCTICHEWHTVTHVDARGRTVSCRRNPHLTVKPLDLARYLAQLIRPAVPARILVPFSGVGSEMIGALLAGWDEILGIEQEEAFCQIARLRLAHWEKQHFQETAQGDLFLRDGPWAESPS